MTANIVRSRPNATFEERIRDSTVVDAMGCWIWKKRLIRGYGAVAADGRDQLAHRWTYEKLVGPIPTGLDLDHLCRQPACVNPAHLEPVTRAENNRRSQSPSAKNLRKKTCDHGHPLSGANLRMITVRGRPSRQCIACQRNRYGLPRSVDGGHDAVA